MYIKKDYQLSQKIITYCILRAYFTKRQIMSVFWGWSLPSKVKLWYSIGTSFCKIFEVWERAIHSTKRPFFKRRPHLPYGSILWSTQVKRNFNYLFVDSTKRFRDRYRVKEWIRRGSDPLWRSLTRYTFPILCLPTPSNQQEFPNEMESKSVGNGRNTCIWKNEQD